MTTSVIVPSYGRPQALRRCLEALSGQEQLPTEVVVVVRRSDGETAALLNCLSFAEFDVRQIHVDEPGVVAALNAGLRASACDIVAITDDDAVPRADWLSQIDETFRGDPRIAAVGGRDWVRYGSRLVTGQEDLAGRLRQALRREPPVGRLQPWGRITSHHHGGVGKPRDVDVLKGVNVSFRTAELLPEGFDERLRGRGSQVHWEVGLCLRLRARGRRLVYDPAIAVDHYPEPRPEGDHREDPDVAAITDAVHNETLGILENVSRAGRVAFAFWAVLIGSKASPGLLQYVRFLITRRRSAARTVAASLRGRWLGWRTFADARQAR